MVVCRRCKTRFNVTAAGVEALPPEDEAPIEEATQAADDATTGADSASGAVSMAEPAEVAVSEIAEAEPVEEFPEPLAEVSQVRSGVSYVKTDAVSTSVAASEPELAEPVEATSIADIAEIAASEMSDSGASENGASDNGASFQTGQLSDLSNLAQAAQDVPQPTFAPFKATADDSSTLAALGPGHDEQVLEDGAPGSTKTDIYQAADYADPYAAGAAGEEAEADGDESGTQVDGPNPFSKKAEPSDYDDDLEEAEVTQRHQDDIHSTSLLPSRDDGPQRRARRDTAPGDSTELVEGKQRRDTGIVPKRTTGAPRKRDDDDFGTIIRPRFPMRALADYGRDLGRYFSSGTAQRKVTMLAVAAIPAAIVAWLIIAAVRPTPVQVRWVSSPTSMWSGPAAQRGYAQVDTLVRGEQLDAVGEPVSDYVLVRDVWGRVGYVYRDSLTDSRPDVTPDSAFPACRTGPTENDNTVCDQRAAAFNESCRNTCSSDEPCKQHCQDRFVECIAGCRQRLSVAAAEPAPAPVVAAPPPTPPEVVADPEPTKTVEKTRTPKKPIKREPVKKAKKKR